MRVTTETVVPLASLFGRVLRASPEWDTNVLAEINKDLSRLERATLWRVVHCERYEKDVVLTDKEIIALSIFQERIQKKWQTESFVPLELKALADCTERQTTVATEQKYVAPERMAEPGSIESQWVW